MGQKVAIHFLRDDRLEQSRESTKRPCGDVNGSISVSRVVKWLDGQVYANIRELYGQKRRP